MGYATNGRGWRTIPGSKLHSRNREKPQNRSSGHRLSYLVPRKINTPAGIERSCLVCEVAPVCMLNVTTEQVNTHDLTVNRSLLARKISLVCTVLACLHKNVADVLKVPADLLDRSKGALRGSR